MRYSGSWELLLPLVLLVAAPAVGHAQVDFGDDTSRWANDGECDDPRFEGPGMADKLMEEDRGHDATDCRTLFEQGRIQLRAGATRAAGQSRDVACENWNTQAYFEAATADDVIGCLQQGADPRAVGEFGETAFHWAARFASAEVVEVLLDAGASADLHLETDGGMRPIHAAAQSGNAEVVEILLRAGASADVLTKTDYRSTTLHYAAESGNADVARILLDAGAIGVIHSETRHDATALHYAARSGDAEMVEVLVGAGADVDSQGLSGQTPLSIAIATGSEEVVTTLRDLGAAQRGWQGRSVCGETPDMQLMIIAQTGDGEWAGVGEREGGATYSLYWGVESTEAEAMDQAGNAVLVAEKLGLDYDTSDPAFFWPRVKPLLLSCSAAYLESGDTVPVRVQVYVMPYTMIEAETSVGSPWHGWDFRLRIR